MDDEEKAARALLLQQKAEAKEAKRLEKEQRAAEKAEIARIKQERRDVRRAKREAKEAEKAERQARRDAGGYLLLSYKSSNDHFLLLSQIVYVSLSEFHCAGPMRI